MKLLLEQTISIYKFLTEEVDGMQYFRTDETGMSTYDNMLKNPEYFRENKNKQFTIVQLNIEKYFDIIAKGRNAQSSSNKEKSATFQENVDKYAKQMEEGTKFMLPVIEFAAYKGSLDMEQEGRHRLLAAQKLGATEVPVLVVYPVKEEDLKVVKDAIELDDIIKDKYKYKLNQLNTRINTE